MDGCRGIWESILLTFQILCFSQEIAALESWVWNLVAAAPLPEGGFPPGEVGMGQWWCALAVAALCISSLQSFFLPFLLGRRLSHTSHVWGGRYSDPSWSVCGFKSPDRKALGKEGCVGVRLAVTPAPCSL